MAVDDGAELVGRDQARDQALGDPGRRGQDHAVGGRDGRHLAGELEPGDPALLEHEAAQAAVQANRRGRPGLEHLQRRLDEGGRQCGVGDARAIGASSLRQGLAHHGAGQIRRSGPRLGVQCRQQERLEQPVPQDAAAVQDLVDPPARLRQKQRAQTQIVGRAGPWNAAPWVEHPPGQGALVGPQQPALIGAQVDEAELGRLRPRQPVLRPDRGQIAHHRLVAGQH